MKAKGKRISKIIRLSEEIFHEFNEFCEEFGFNGNAIIEIAIIDFMKKHTKRKK